MPYPTFPPTAGSRHSVRSTDVATRDPQPLKILVVDDEPGPRYVLTEILERSPSRHEITSVGTGREAIEQVGAHDFDVVVTDINMPEMSGLELLQAIRVARPDLPVLLITGAADSNHVSDAVRYGAMFYLTKPLVWDDFVNDVEQAGRLHHLTRLRKEAMELGRISSDVDRHAERRGQWTRALSGLFMVYQPIVRWSSREIYAYEALVRTTEPTVPNPGALLDLAEQLGTLSTLGHRIRQLVTEPLDRAIPGTLLFVNLHSRDLLDERLFLADSPLAKVSHRVVLEITERANLDGIEDSVQRIANLKALGFRIAVDDIGAGYAGLNSFVTLAPDIIKLDMALVRDIDANELKQKLVRSLIELCTDMSIGIIAEGVETDAELHTLLALGCDLFQGYRFAKPAAPFVAAVFD